MSLNQTIVALDQMSLDEIDSFLARPENTLSIVKIGLELFIKYGPDLVHKIHRDYKKKIFLDLKLHDIPVTVQRAIHSLKNLPIDFLTIHLSGGEEMQKAAIKEARQSIPQCKILGVSFLTSLEERDLHDLFGITDGQVAFLRLFKVAHDSGIDGIVCSPHEILLLKSHYPNLLAITPGIRFEDEILTQQVQDQKRVSTPKEALLLGADFIVMGRSLTKSPDLGLRLKELMAILILAFMFLLTPSKTLASTDSDQAEQLIGPQIARVIVPRAIVYSDENMNSPLGYISNDKLITVGNPRKRKPELLPLVVYGRLAFIEVKNIQFENESMEILNSKRGAPREHNIDIILTKPEEKLSENNSGYFFIHQFSAGEETKNLVNTIDGSTKNNFIGFEISLIHRQLTGRAFWGAGYEYNILSTPNLKFELYMLTPTVGYTPIKNPLFLIDLTFSLDFAISAQLKIENNSVREPSSFAWGPQVGTRVVFFPNQKYHAVGALTYRSYKVLRLEALEDQNGGSISGITKISGINLSLGVAIEI